MANFNTHFNVALIASTILATYGLMSEMYRFIDAIMLVVAGTIGGLLPDIDLNHSKVSRIGFNIASGIGAGFVVILSLKHNPTIPLHALLWGGFAFLVIRHGVFWLFGHITTHRGMVHSVPYMAVIALLFINFLTKIMKISLALSWLVGGFIFFGAMVHLILDELYSVNILGMKIKKSFGTAFKFFDKKNPFGYIILYSLLLWLWIISPTDLVTSKIIHIIKTY